MWVTQGEYGIQLRWTVYRRGVVEDLSTMTTLQLLLRNPVTGVLSTLTLTAVNLASGLVGYTPPDATIFPNAGVYEYQLRFANASASFRTRKASITVEPSV